MLTVSEAIKQRRSIRKFRPDPVPLEAVKEMLEAARLAPSGSNRQPWRFIAVTNAAEKAKLRKICLDQAFVEEAPLVFVCCADLTAYAQASRKKRNQEFIDAGVVQSLSGAFADLSFREWMVNQPDPDLKEYAMMAIANSYIAIEHMVLTATALGLSTCWVGATGNAEDIPAMFKLPSTMITVAVLPTGYPAQSPPQRPRVPLSEILLRPLEG
jgi:nitroreductase